MSDETETPERHSGALVVLLPAESDPITAATSEDMAHMTTIWFGDVDEMPVDRDELAQAVSAYADDLDGPVVVPVLERGTLGDDDADVVFLEATESILALRDGLLENDLVRQAYEAAEQFPQWTPHVTLGYPEGVEGGPAVAEYDGTEVTFDRIGLWLGGDYTEYPMGGVAMTAAATDPTDIAVEVADEEDLPLDELEDDEEEITEIPVHGVATIEGRATGDGRMFKKGALTHRNLPLPLRLEIVGTHGGTTSDVVPVGRIDEMWRVEGDEYNEYRYRGVIITTKEYAAQAIEGIVDGSLTGVSVETDSTTMDPEHEEAQAAAFQKVLDGQELSADEKALMRNQVYSESRVCGFTIVPIPAFQEANIALGEAFEDELSDEDRAALAACGCSEGEFREVSQEERDKLADEGKAMPDGSFPIANEEDLRNAIQSIGRAKDPEAAKRHIKKRARALDKEDLIPEDWSLLADGGFIPGGKRVLVGEHGPEYIIPKSALSRFAPGTKDGPGWITHPIPTSRIRRYWTRGKGAAKIKWGVPGDFNRCRNQLRKYIANPDWLAGACANMHKEAIGVWPGQESGGRHALLASGAQPAPLFTLTAAAKRVLPAEWFQRVEMENPREGVVVDGDRVYGYIAQWGVCHIGIEGACTTAPQSMSNYAYYATGVVHTDDGNTVRVGQITMDTGHASLRASMEVAAAHYDNTGAAVADIAVGEDEFGIWFAGALRPSATEDQIFALEASGRLSGDWRSINYGPLELIAALAVNVPGFPIPAHAAIAASAGHQTALVAAGIVEPEAEEQVAEEDENVDFVARVVERVEERRAEREQAAALRRRLEEKEAAEARRRLERIS